MCKGNFKNFSRWLHPPGPDVILGLVFPQTFSYATKRARYMSITDAVSAAISLGFVANGWFKGFMRVILGPLSLIVGTVISYVYYQTTKNVPIALLIGLIGPFLLKFSMQFAVNTWNSTIDRNLPPSFISRTIGASLGFLWGACIIGITVLMIAVIPLPSGTGTLQKIQQDVQNSFIFSRLPSPLAKNLSSTNAQQVNGAFTALNNEEMAKRLQSSKEFKTLMEDPQIQEIFKDEATIKQIENKDLGKLLTNKKFLKLLQDPKLIQKMMQLHSTVSNPTPQQPLP